MEIKKYSDISASLAGGSNSMGWTNTMMRSNALPIDSKSIFKSWDDAVDYVNTSKLAYEGQIIAVTVDNKQVAYVVDTTAADGLRRVGNDSVSVSADISAIAESYALSAEQIARSELSAAKDVLSGEISSLTDSVSMISADHESRIEANEKAIDLLSSAVHFRGALLEEDITKAGDVATEAEIKAALVKKFAPCAKGDLVIYTTQATEYIYCSDTDGQADEWEKLGDEGTYVKKTDYATKTAELEAADEDLSAAISAEVERATAIEIALSSAISTAVSAHNAYAKSTDKSISELSTASEQLSTAIDNKVKVGTYGSELSSSDLSVVKIADEDYYKLVAEDKADPNVVYIVSADYVNGHDQRVINVGDAVEPSDAVNLDVMQKAIAAAKTEVTSSSLSGVTLNGQAFEIKDNVAMLSIDIIDCGTAS